MLTKVLQNSGFLILIPVLGSLLAAVAVLLYGAYDLLKVASLMLGEGEAGKQVAVAVTELIDLFLLGTVLYIVAIGLYELFVDPHIVTPAWLHIESLEDLKEKLIGVIIVLLAVVFLGQTVEWKAGFDILALGGAVALVSAALALLLISGQKYRFERERPDRDGLERIPENRP